MESKILFIIENLIATKKEFHIYFTRNAHSKDFHNTSIYKEINELVSNILEEYILGNEIIHKIIIRCIKNKFFIEFPDRNMIISPGELYKILDIVN